MIRINKLNIINENRDFCVGKKYSSIIHYVNKNTSYNCTLDSDLKLMLYIYTKLLMHFYSTLLWPAAVIAICKLAPFYFFFIFIISLILLYVLN